MSRDTLPTKKVTQVLSSRLRILIRMRQVSQKEIAAETGISEAQVSAYVKGRYLPSLTTTVLMANALDVSVDYLLGLTNTITRR